MKIITKICIGCGEKFTLSSYLRNQKRYCTPRCAYDHRKVFSLETIERVKYYYCEEQKSLSDIGLLMGLKYHNVRKILKDIGVVVRSNSEQQRLNFRADPTRHVGSYTVVKCGQCGELLHRGSSQIRRNENRSGKCFCSKECFDVYQTIRDEIVRYGKGWNSVRRLVRKRDKCCQVCYKIQTRPKRQLSVHHISPMRWFGSDKKRANALDNLVGLCDQCHTAVDNRIRKHERTLSNIAKQGVLNRIGQKSLEEVRHERRKITSDGGGS